MALDADRARSIESVVRTAGSMMTKLGLTDVTKLGGVKAHMKDLLVGVSMEHEPATTATPTMLEWCINEGIDQRYTGSFVIDVEKVFRDYCEVRQEAGGYGGQALPRGEWYDRGSDRHLLWMAREDPLEGDAGALRLVEHQQEYLYNIG